MQHIQQYPHIRLFLFGWNKDASHEGSRIPISVPPTLIFEHGVPKAVLLPEDEVAEFLGGTTAGTNSFEAEFSQAQARYLEDREAQLHAVLEQRQAADKKNTTTNNNNSNRDQQGTSKNNDATGGDDSSSTAQMIPEPHIVTSRRSPKDVSHPMVLAAMCNPVKAPDTGDPEAVVAYFVGIVEGERGESRVDIRYMNREQLKRFFAKRELPDREGTASIEENAQDRDKGQKQSAILADCRMRTKEDDFSSQVQQEILRQQMMSEQQRQQQQQISNQTAKFVKSPSLSPATLSVGHISRENSSLPPPSLNLDGTTNNTNAPTTPSHQQQHVRAKKKNSTRDRSQPQQQQQNNNTLTGFLQRFEYTPSHHSEIVTMRWTRSYCDFERIRNDLLLEDRSRRAAERAATVDAPPTLVRRYSVTDRLKTLMRVQADLLADRFNASMQHAGRNFSLKQATFLFKMGFHGHVYFLWCSKMQLEKYHPSGHPGQDWIALVRRPPHTAPTTQNTSSSSPSNTNYYHQHHNESTTTDQQQQNENDTNNPAGNLYNHHHAQQQQQNQVPRFHAFGRMFLDIGQDMLDRETMLRNKGLSKELGDLEENPLQQRGYRDYDDDDEDYSPRRRNNNNNNLASTNTNTSKEGPNAGVGLMPLYSEHRIAVTQAQRHLGKALPLPLTLLTNVMRREENARSPVAVSNSNQSQNQQQQQRRANSPQRPSTNMLTPTAHQHQQQAPALRSPLLRPSSVPIRSPLEDNLARSLRNRSFNNSNSINPPPPLSPKALLELHLQQQQNSNNANSRRSPTTGLSSTSFSNLNDNNNNYTSTGNNNNNNATAIVQAYSANNANRASKTKDLLNAARSLRGNRDKMLEILKEADHSLHGRFERPKLRHAGQTYDKNSSSNHNSPSNKASSFVKEDANASDMTAKLIRLLGARGRQAAKMMPELLAQFEREKQEQEQSVASPAHFDNNKSNNTIIKNENRNEFSTTKRGVEFTLNDDELIVDDIEATESESNQSRRKRSPSPQQQQIASSNNNKNHTNPHFGGPALARSVIASWKSWVAVFLRRVREYEIEEQKQQQKEKEKEKLLQKQKEKELNSGGSLQSGEKTPTSKKQQQQHSPSSSSLPSSPNNNSKGKSISPLYKVSTWATSSINNSPKTQQRLLMAMSASANASSSSTSGIFNDDVPTISVFKNPIASSVPVELLELHFRQLKIVHRNNNNNKDKNSNTVASRNEDENEDLMNLPCLEFWRKKFERCLLMDDRDGDKDNDEDEKADDNLLVRVLSAEEARETDKLANQQFHVDDCSLHNCEVIEDSDIFCFKVRSVMEAEEICRMIHRSCSFSSD